METEATGLAAELAAAEDLYAAARPKSRARFDMAREVMPGGNTRTVIHYPPFPFGVEKAEGPWLHDLDGFDYLDFQGEYSAGILGHSHPKIREATLAALEGGLSYGAPNRSEAQFAAEICGRFPSVDMVRFTNSGTEANLMAFTTARAVTGRDKILVMRGGYHGAVFVMSPYGAKTNAPYPWVEVTMNDADDLRAVMAEHGSEIAGAVIEPMMGSSGGIVARTGFLQLLRDECTARGIVLIFDEVMTSRMSPGGMQASLGIIPDMTTLGKYLGGGFTFGAFGGRREIMELYDPDRPDGLKHAGTFNNNVMTMAAGLTTLRDILDAQTLDDLNARGDRLRDGINHIAQDHQVRMQALGYGSIFTIHFQTGEIRNPFQLNPENEKRALLHLHMIDHGILIARRSYIALSIALTDAHCDRFLSAFAEFCRRYRHLL